ncbi:MAG: TlpA family protein disulfide reductase [Candidatus Kariarchaeaceae archaeon]|jgi:thiol-disulfide isomerase/thioredoxin
MKKFGFSFIVVMLILSSINHSQAGLNGQYQRHPSGQAVDLSTHEGQFLFIEAMSPGCGACKEQHPILDELFQSHGSKMKMLSLAIFADDTLASIADFVNDYPTGWEIGLDHNRDFAAQFKLDSTPQMLFFNRDTQLVRKWVGLTPLDDLVGVINSYIDEGNTIVDTDNTGGQSGDDNSILGDLFGSPAFLLGMIVIVSLLIYFQMTKKPPVT